jgi:hypothetical protein
MWKSKLVLLALVAALAAVGTGWKWTQPGRPGHAGGQQKIAGWTWDESAVWRER